MAFVKHSLKPKGLRSSANSKQAPLHKAAGQLLERAKMKYVVVMEGVTGCLYRTECDTVKEAIKLEEHHKNLGWNAWIEYEGSDDDGTR